MIRGTFPQDSGRRGKRHCFTVQHVAVSSRHTWRHKRFSHTAYTPPGQTIDSRPVTVAEITEGAGERREPVCICTIICPSSRLAACLADGDHQAVVPEQFSVDQLLSTVFGLNVLLCASERLQCSVNCTVCVLSLIHI